VRAAQPAAPGSDRPQPHGHDRHRGGRRQEQRRNGASKSAQPDRAHSRPEHAKPRQTPHGQPGSNRANPSRGNQRPASPGPARANHPHGAAHADQHTNDLSRIAFLNRQTEPRRNPQRRIADRPE
jgi:hypothetical protein